MIGAAGISAVSVGTPSPPHPLLASPLLTLPWPRPFSPSLGACMQVGGQPAGADDAIAVHAQLEAAAHAARMGRQRLEAEAAQWEALVTAAGEEPGDGTGEEPGEGAVAGGALDDAGLRARYDAACQAVREANATLRSATDAHSEANAVGKVPAGLPIPLQRPGTTSGTASGTGRARPLRRRHAIELLRGYGLALERCEAEWALSESALCEQVSSRPPPLALPSPPALGLPLQQPSVSTTLRFHNPSPFTSRRRWPPFGLSPSSTPCSPLGSPPLNLPLASPFSPVPRRRCTSRAP